MARVAFDCREWPGSCTLAISGEPEEVVEAQALHVVQAHQQSDGPALRDMIRGSLKPAPAEW